MGLPFWLALSRCSLGWLAAKQGDPAKGLDLVVQGLDSLDTLGVVLHREWAGGGLMSDILMWMGRHDEANVALDEAISFTARAGVGWFDAELYRRKGELLLNIPVPQLIEAEQQLRQAIEIACGQSAKLFELRAATSLARLWSGQGLQAEACDLLAPVYDWFTEGFGSLDLQEARAVLAELGEPRPSHCEGVIV